MFHSVSSCTPNSQVTVDFVSNFNQSFFIGNVDSVRVNGTTVSSFPMQLSVGDHVSATVTTPLNYLGYNFYEYQLEGRSQYFAVVNKNLYQPTVKIPDAPKRWFNYQPSAFEITYYDDPTKSKYSLGFGRRKIDILSSHVICDHINDAVCFYSTSVYDMIARVNIPGGPIEYRKTTYIKSDGSTDYEVIVLCNDRRLYKIRFDHQFFESGEYKPTVIPIGFPNNLSFEQDLPTGETFVEYRRRKILSKLSPVISAMDIKGSQVWLAGYDSVFILTKNFDLVKHIIIERQTINSIACINNDAIVTTRAGNAYYVSSTGSATFLYGSEALGVPGSFNNGTAVAIPDSNNQRLLVFTGNSPSYTVWNTPEFVPAFAREFEGHLWVTGHDNNQILKFTSPTTFETYTFSNKVAVASVVEDSIVAVHYLQEFSTLDSTNIKKIIPFKIENRRGPVTHIGTNPVTVKMLGQEGIQAIAGPKITCWINGVSGEVINTGDYVGVSYRADYPGKFRSAFIIGEHAIDYEVDVVDQPVTYLSNIFVANSTVTPLTTPFNSNLVPTVGNLDSGSTGPINLGFNFGIYGNIYSQINVGTNGYITFGNNRPTSAVSSVGQLNVDAIYVEVQDLFQGNAINNTNPTSIVSIPLSSGEVPGVYYKTGSTGGFNFVKIRWVGTSANSFPLGNTTSVLTSISNSTRIPVNFSAIALSNVNDRISGNGIVIPTRVTGNSSFTVNGLTAFISNAITNTLYITPTVNNDTTFNQITADLKYATVTTGSSVGYLQSFNKSSIPLSTQSPIEYNQSGASIVLDGTVPNVVTGTVWGLDFTYYFRPNPLIASLTPIRLISTINTVTRTTSTITVITSPSSSSFTVSAQDFALIYIGQTLYSFSIINGRSKVLNKFIDSFGNPRIQLYGIHNLQAGDTVVGFDTRLTFNSLPVNDGPFIIAHSALSMSIDLNSITGFIPVQGQPVPLLITGNYIHTAVPCTISSNTNITIKTITSTTPALTYELGIYADDTNQFVEFFYDSPNHSSATPSGFGSSDSQYTPTIKNLATGRSWVFYSPNRFGYQWNFLGEGKINSNSPKINYRDVVIYKSTTDLENHSRIEFIVDQKLTANNTVVLSTDYGYINRRSEYYTGNTYIQENDLISLTVPFNRSQRPIAPMVTIGQHQFAVPIASPTTTLPNEKLVLFDNQSRGILVTGNVTVDVTGTYYIPDYYRYSLPYSEFEVIFTRTRAGQTVVINQLYNEFSAGDIITVANFVTSSAFYDTREVVIVGPEILRMQWRTVKTSQLFDYLNFGTIFEPYANNVNYFIGNIGALTNIISEIENYQTQIITLTSTTPITGNLFVDTPNVQIIVNGVWYNNYVTNVATGSNVSLYREITTICASNVTLYQVDFDTVTSSNIYIPVGEWNVNNKIITGSTFVSAPTQPNVDLDSYFVDDNISTGKLNDALFVKSNDSKVDAIQNNSRSDSSQTTFILDRIQNTPDVSETVYHRHLSKILSNLDAGRTYIDTQSISSLGKSETSAFSYIATGIKNTAKTDSSEYTFLSTKGIKPESRSDSSSLSYLKIDSVKNTSKSDSAEFNVIFAADIQAQSKSDSSGYNFLSVDSVNNDIKSESSSISYSEIDTIINSPRSESSSISYITVDDITNSILSESSSISYITVDDIKNSIKSESSSISYELVDSVSFIGSDSNEYSYLLTEQIAWNKSITSEFSYIVIDDITNSSKSESSTFTYNLINDVSFDSRSDSIGYSYILGEVMSLGKSISSEFSYIVVDDVKNNINSESASYSYMSVDQVKANEKSDTAEYSYIRVETDSTGRSIESEFSFIMSDSLVNNSKSDSAEFNFNLIDQIKFNGKSDTAEFNYLLGRIKQGEEIDYTLNLVDIVNSVKSETRDINYILSKDISFSGRSEEMSYIYSSTAAEILRSQIDIPIDISPELLAINLQFSGVITSKIAMDEINEIRINVVEELFRPYREIYLTNDGRLDIEPLTSVPLPPVQDIEPLIPVPLPPVQDIEPLIPVPLPLVLDIENKLLPKLTPLEFYETQIYRSFDYVFDEDIIWTPTRTEVLTYGAYKTEIKIFTAAGNYGDIVTMYGPVTSENYGILPFVLRSKNYNYSFGGFANVSLAENQTKKFVNAVPFSILGTDFWNYRIYLNTKRYSIPRKGRVFPVIWYMRGG